MDYITRKRQAKSTAIARTTTTSDRLTTVLSYGALLLLGYLVYLIVAPFIVPLAWSAVFAIFFYSVHEHLEKRFSPTIAALISTTGVMLLLIVPVLLIFLYATREAVDATARIQAMLQNGTAPVPQDMLNWVRDKLPQSLQDVDYLGYLRQGAEKAATFLASKFGALVKNLFSFFVHLFILLFALFFMFRDGRQILGALRHLIPFERDLQEDMISESRDLIFASVAVALLIAAIQGALGGLAFEITGLGAPVFMAVLIAFFSIVPVVGSALIWVPAALWLGLNGHWGKALVVLAICGGVAGVADN